MAETNLKKNKQGYGYKYTELAEIHNYLETINAKYIQFIKRIDGDDYIMTKRCFNNKWEEEALQGCKVVQATLSGKSNPAQEQGSALTYARRYSLLMAFGLATEDDDAESLTKSSINKQKNTNEKITEIEAKSIYALMIRKGYDVIPTLQEYFNVNNTSELSRKQYMEIIDKCNKLPDKK